MPICIEKILKTSKCGIVCLQNDKTRKIWNIALIKTVINASNAPYQHSKCPDPLKFYIPNTPFENWRQYRSLFS